MKLFLHKLFHWEYWPFELVYIPIYFLWSYYAIRTRTLFFFNACNPGMANGGFFMDSKMQIYGLIPPQFYPATRWVREGLPLQILQTLAGNNFPLIAKPDIGLRGSAVKKIEDFEQLKNYHNKANFDYILQDWIPYPNEAGIFYVRFPHEKKGRITGIVAKEFLIVEGDGISSIEELIKANPRYELQLAALKKEYGYGLETVLQKGEKKNLVPYGNHARGAKFLDYSHLVTPQLNEVIDAMCLQVPGFYFGRMDLMYSSWEELEKGEKFLVVELNGAASEPTHIYDPKHSLFFAWKELARHIRYMAQISMANHKQGVPYLSHQQGMRQYRMHLAHFNKIVHF